MRLDDLCELFDQNPFPKAHVREHPERDTVRAARAAVTAAVRDDEFLIDCMARELSVVERAIPRRGMVPFYTMPGSGIRFSFGYWPPGSNAGAHEHSAWTITAVCRNQLVVQTYDRDESYRRQTLVPKRRFDAPAGRVGFIYEPAIHDPHNATDRWSLSLHVTSPRDGEQLADHDMCLPILDDFVARQTAGYGDPYERVIAARHRQIVIRQVARIVAHSHVGQIEQGLLDKCFRLGTQATKRCIDSSGREELIAARVGSAYILTRTHDNLALDVRDAGDMVALGVETSRGWVQELAVASVAREAITFCARTPTFDVRQLPGNLSTEERWAIACALEESGLFRMEVSR